MRYVGYGIALLSAALGCSGPVPERYSSVAISDSQSQKARGGGENFDFGNVLADGRFVRHDFTLKNETKTPLHVTSAVALTPCCSSVGPISEEALPAGGTLRIPTALRAAADHVEYKNVGFVVRTDSPGLPELTFSIRAGLYPGFTIDRPDDESSTVLAGMPQERRWRLISRRVGNEGGDLPIAVEAESPLAATFSGVPSTQNGPAGVITTSRDVAIRIPPSTNQGDQSRFLRLRWADGHTDSATVAWKVVPVLRSIPRSVLVRRSELDKYQTLTIRSGDDRPFRIVSVGPATLVDDAKFGSESDRSQSVEIRLKPGRVLDEHQGSKVLINQTNHPLDPKVEAPIWILGTGA
jgi:hypothetical protein